MLRDSVRDYISIALECIKGKRIAVIGGNNIMEDVCRFAKNNSVTVITIASSDASPVHRYSDEQYVADCSNPFVMIPLLKEARIDSIIAISGEKMQRKVVNWIFQSGYRFYATPEQWSILMDKQKFQQYAVQFGIPAIPEYSLRIDHKSVLTRFPFPVVIKPTDNCGSSGVCICSEDSDLTEAYNNALLFSSNGRVICEKYLKGAYFQFEIWNQNGKSFIPYTKERIFYQPIGQHPPQPFLDIYPSTNSKLLSIALFDRTEKLLQSLGIRNGSCVFQGIINNGNPFIMDTAFRVSGGLDYKVVWEEKGIDLVGAYIQYALSGQFGEDFSELSRPYKYTYANLCVGLKDGVISRIDGVDAIRRLPGLFAVHQCYQEGDTVRTGAFSQIGLRIFLKAKDRASLIGCIEKALKKLRVENEKGESMLLPFPEIMNIKF